MRCRHGRRLRCLRTRALLLPSVHSTANPICLLQVSDRILGVGERIALAAHSAGRGSPRRAVGHLSGSWRRPAAQSGSLAGTVACAGDPHAFAGPSLVASRARPSAGPPSAATRPGGAATRARGGSPPTGPAATTPDPSPPAEPQKQVPNIRPRLQAMTGSH
jgi:hypothetical protein